jgi:hypothetical protein
MWSLCGVFIESTWSPEGLSEIQRTPQGLHETLFHGFHGDSLWTLRGLLVDSPLRRVLGDCLPYLFKDLMKKKLPITRVEPETFRSVII